MPADRNLMETQIGKKQGIYLFCFARPHCLPDAGIVGLDDRQPVSQRTFKDIVTVSGIASLEDFCGPEAENRMKELAWIGPRINRHEEVIEVVMRKSPVFPARFGTIFSSFNILGKFLKAHYAEISRFLDKATGKDEFAVKGLLNKAQARDNITTRLLSQEEGRLAALSPGKRYLGEQRIRSRADRELNLWLQVVIKGIGDDLCRHSFEFCERKVLSLDSEGMEMVLNWAFWVERKEVDDFRAAINRANEEYDTQGLRLQISGPWPPYSFHPSLAGDD